MRNCIANSQPFCNHLSAVDSFVHTYMIRSFTYIQLYVYSYRCVRIRYVQQSSNPTFFFHLGSCSFSDVSAADREGFLLSKQMPIALERLKVTSVDLLPLPLYVKYRWLVDFFVCSLVVYSITELHLWLTHGAAQSADINLSAVWLSVALIFALCVALPLRSSWRPSLPCMFVHTCASSRSLLILCLFLISENL